MNEKKVYLWKLAEFLYFNDKQMSVPELATHLNRNNFLTSYGTEYQGKRGTYALVSETYNWLESLGLIEEAKKVSVAFPKPDDSFAYE
jgi:hypothetical protein